MNGFLKVTGLDVKEIQSIAPLHPDLIAAMIQDPANPNDDLSPQLAILKLVAERRTSSPRFLKSQLFAEMSAPESPRSAASFRNLSQALVVTFTKPQDFRRLSSTVMLSQRNVRLDDRFSFQINPVQYRSIVGNTSEEENGIAVPGSKRCAGPLQAPIGLLDYEFASRTDHKNLQILRIADKAAECDPSETTAIPPWHGTQTAGVLLQQCPDCPVYAYEVACNIRGQGYAYSTAVARALFDGVIRGVGVFDLSFAYLQPDPALAPEIEVVRKANAVLLAPLGDSRSVIPVLPKGTVYVAATTSDGSLWKESNTSLTAVKARGTHFATSFSPTTQGVASSTSLAAANVAGMIAQSPLFIANTSATEIARLLASQGLSALWSASCPAPPSQDSSGNPPTGGVPPETSPQPPATKVPVSPEPTAAAPQPTQGSGNQEQNPPGVDPGGDKSLALCPPGSQKTTPGICGCDEKDEDKDGDGSIDCSNPLASIPSKASGNVSPFTIEQVILPKSSGVKVSATAERKEYLAIVDTACSAKSGLSPYFSKLLTIPADVKPSDPFHDALVTFSPPDQGAAGLTEMQKAAKLDPCVIGITEKPTQPISVTLSAVSFNDPAAPKQTYLNDTKYREGYEIFQELFKGLSRKVVVGTIDTGYDFANEDAPEVSPNLFGANQAQILWPRGNESPDKPQDSDGHGTAVGSIIAAQQNNAKGMVGLAGETASLYPLRLIRDATETDSRATLTTVTGLYDAIRRSVNAGATVVNISVNTMSPDGQATLCDATNLHALYKGIEKNVFFVMSAGNGVLIDKNRVLVPGPLYSPSDDGPQKFEYTSNPACGGAYLSGALTVAGLQSGGTKLNDFSNWGQAVEIAAPGSNILSYGLKNELKEFSGSSFAAPQVSAAVALIKAVCDARGWLNCSPWWIEDVLKNASPVVPELLEYTNGGRRLDFKALAEYLKSLLPLTDAERAVLPAHHQRWSGRWAPDRDIDLKLRLVLSTQDNKTTYTPGQSVQLIATLIEADGSTRDVTSRVFFTSSSAQKAPVGARTGTIQFSSTIHPLDKEKSFRFIAHFEGMQGELMLTPTAELPRVSAIEVAPITMQWASLYERVKVFGVDARDPNTKHDLSGYVSLRSGAPEELRILPGNILSSFKAKAGSEYQLTATFGSLSASGTVKVTRRATEQALEIHSPIGTTALQGQMLTLFSRFASKTSVDYIPTDAAWNAPDLGIKQTARSITIDTAKLKVGEYPITATQRYRGDGSDAEYRASFVLKVVDSLHRLELINFRPIVNFRERTAFFLRLFPRNNSYEIIDPGHVTWSTSDPTRLVITPQGVVIPSEKSLINGSQTTYTISAKFQQHTLTQRITISPLHTTTGVKASLVSLRIGVSPAARVQGISDDEIPYSEKRDYNVSAVYSDGRERNVTGSASWSLAHYDRWRVGPGIVYSKYGSNPGPAYGGEQNRLTVMYEGVVAHKVLTATKREFISGRIANISDPLIVDTKDGTFIWPAREISTKMTLTERSQTVSDNAEWLGAFNFKWSSSNSELNSKLATVQKERFILNSQGLPFGELPITWRATFRGRGFDEEVSATGALTVKRGNDLKVEKVLTFYNATGDAAFSVRPLDGMFSPPYRPGAAQFYRDENSLQELSLEENSNFNRRFHSSLVATMPGCKERFGCEWVPFDNVSRTVKDLTTGQVWTAPVNVSSPLRYDSFDVVPYLPEHLGRTFLVTTTHIPTGATHTFTVRGVGKEDFRPTEQPGPVPVYTSQLKSDLPLCTAERKALSSFAGGSGRRDDPFIICSESQLINIERYSRTGPGNTFPSYLRKAVAYYRLGANLDFSSSTNLAPISLPELWEVEAKGFILDGDGYAVSQPTIIDSEQNEIGLFKKPIHPREVLEVKNLRIRNPQIRGKDYVGALFGHAVYPVTISGISVEGGNVWGENYVGAIAGLARTIDYSFATDTLVSVEKQVGGGLAGRVEELRNSWSSGVVQSVGVQGGQGMLGGVVGEARSLFNVSFSGEIRAGNNSSGASTVGGIAGTASRVVYAKFSGSITATGSFVGGIVGTFGRLQGDNSGQRYKFNTVISNANSSGSIVAGNNRFGLSGVGGIAGAIGDASILDSVSSVNISAVREAGGLIGRMMNNVRIARTESSATVNTSSGEHGGFAGSLDSGFWVPSFDGKRVILQPILKDNTWTGANTPEVGDIGLVGSKRNVDVDGVTRQ